MTDRLASTAEGVAAAAAILRGGGVVAFPTDTVYGIGCRADDADALARVFAAKRRDPDKAVVLLVDSLDAVAARGVDLDPRTRSLAERYWPGGLTLVLPMPGGGSQGFRMPDHPVALALIAAAGPLATSSANRSGEPETYDADDVTVAFADADPGELDAILDGGRVPGGTASSVLELGDGQPRLLREGALARAELEGVVGPID